MENFPVFSAVKGSPERRFLQYKNIFLKQVPAVLGFLRDYSV